MPSRAAGPRLAGGGRPAGEEDNLEGGAHLAVRQGEAVVVDFYRAGEDGAPERRRMPPGQGVGFAHGT